MENKDIRWKQRFQNFERTLQYLEQALNISEPDIIQKAGLIQFFEMSFDNWRLVFGGPKDHAKGIREKKKGPGSDQKLAFSSGNQFLTDNFTITSR